MEKWYFVKTWEKAQDGTERVVQVRLHRGTIDPIARNLRWRDHNKLEGNHERRDEAVCSGKEMEAVRLALKNWLGKNGVRVK